MMMVRLDPAAVVDVVVAQWEGVMSGTRIDTRRVWQIIDR